METIRICRDKNVLREYLESRESEVISIMMTLFDEEKIMRTRENRIRREEKEREKEKGIRLLIETCQRMGGTVSETVDNLILSYGVSKEDSHVLVEKYWK